MREAASRGTIQSALALMPANTIGYLSLLKNEKEKKGAKTATSTRRNQETTEETTSATTHKWK